MKKLLRHSLLAIPFIGVHGIRTAPVEINDEQYQTIVSILNATIKPDSFGEKVCNELLEATKAIGALAQSNDEWQIILSDKAHTAQIIDIIIARLIERNEYIAIYARRHLENNGRACKALIALVLNCAGANAWLIDQVHHDPNTLEELLVRFASSRELEFIKKLLSLGVSANATGRISDPNSSVSSALIVAAECGNTDAVRLLLDNGADIEAKSNSRFKKDVTALMIAAHEGHSNILHLLIDRGAQLNVTNRDGDTAYMMAINKGMPKSARILLKAGAYPNTPGLENNSDVSDYLNLIDEILESPETTSLLCTP
jgi:ankyrin repeat protein